MLTQSQYGQPLFVEGFGSTPAQGLNRVQFVKDLGEGVDYDEAWLQGLIMQHPALLPVGQIEPYFEGLLPICTELPVPGGSVDNLYVTPSGNIALVECKLFRNPEARRKVVAQIIDYATELSKWSYDNLEGAIKRAKAHGDVPNGIPQTLYERVSSTGGTDERVFIDAVSRNLRLGRFLLLVIGDGIQEGVLGMSEFLQQHAGLHFTLGLVELAFFHLPAGGYVAQPRVFAKTTNVERGIVRFDDARVSINAGGQVASIIASPARPMSISKEQFLERFEQLFPGVGAMLNSFLDRLPDHAVEAEFDKSLILRWHGDDAKGWNLGQITSAGDLWTDVLRGRAMQRGLLEDAERYVTDLKNLVPGAGIKLTPGGNEVIVYGDGRRVKIDALLGDASRVEGWLQAIARFQAGVTRAS